MHRFLLFLIGTATITRAFPTGAGWCIGGRAAVGAPHRTENQVITDTDFVTGGFVVVVDGQEISTITQLGIHTDYSLSLQAGDTPFKGILMRVSTDVEAGTILTADSELLQEANVCSAPVVGVTHVNNSLKTNAPMTLRLEAPATVTLDVTVVVENNLTFSVYAYSQYTVAFLDLPSPAPIALDPVPTALATERPNTPRPTFPYLTEQPTTTPTLTVISSPPTILPDHGTSATPTIMDAVSGSDMPSDMPSDVPSDVPSSLPWLDPTLPPLCSNLLNAYEQCLDEEIGDPAQAVECEYCVASSFPGPGTTCGVLEYQVCRGLAGCEACSTCRDELLSYIGCVFAENQLDCQMDCSNVSSSPPVTAPPTLAPVTSTASPEPTGYPTVDYGECTSVGATMDICLYQFDDDAYYDCDLCIFRAESVGDVATCEEIQSMVCAVLDRCECDLCNREIEVYLDCTLRASRGCAIDCANIP